ncbi:hypothetical protein BGW38_007342 [Lunasporangiospora selenospora]|uniref:Ion transport domain-containing protein n=1 Tax=Lunasporangiospora selenospora TaxID=979761 RepID=A0A9P6KGK5_9FUNG|nr:hypothetical protein BGW38_007342 [Lunasporangiospora selenospora]
MADTHDYDHDNEETPLLSQEEQNVDHHNNPISELVDTLRDVFENQIPNGHHVTPPSSPRKIHALLPRLFTLINSLVDTASVEDDIITDEVVEYLSGFGREVVYCLLRCIETFLEEGDKDVGRKRLMEKRAEITQIAAAQVVKTFVSRDIMATYCQVLTRPYYAAVHATDFLADVEVQRCVQALWNGLILQTEDEECRVRFVEYSGVRRSRHNLWEWVDVGRLNVPKYQNNLKIAMFIVFMILYSIVVNDRKAHPTIFEWVLYIFVTGYTFEEFRLIFEGGTAFFLGSLWHWVNIISYSMFLLAFAFRFTALVLVSDEKDQLLYTNYAYDLLAILAVFLWVKTLSLLDGLQYFGTMVMVLQKMLKDGIMFFWLLAWFFIGFLQSFYALQSDEEKNFISSVMLLVRGFLQDADWELANEIDQNYGNWIFAMYLFLTSIILLNLLIALFNSSYTNITDSAEKEYLALFTFKVFSYLKSPDEFPYAAPFNLIEVFLVIPWGFVVSRDTYRWVNRKIMGTLFCIPVLIIARSERKRYQKLKDTIDEHRIQGGRRVYRYLTREDAEANMDDLFLLATQELVEEQQQGDPLGGSETPATIDSQDLVNAAEEGEAGTNQGSRSIGNMGSRSALKMGVSPLETFDEFKERRTKEKAAKATAAAAKGQTMRAVIVEGGSSLSASTALTDTLVQGLLASLARMEARQTEMEKLLQTYVAKEKESQAIALSQSVGAEHGEEEPQPESAEQEEQEQEEEEEKGDDE